MICDYRTFYFTRISCILKLSTTKNKIKLNYKKDNDTLNLNLVRNLFVYNFF